MEDLDRAYLAGFFDGEGSISIAKGDRSKFRTYASPMWSLRVSLANQHLPILLWVQREFNGTLHTQINKTSGVFRWIAQTRIAENFLREIQSYVRVKKAQVELALSFQELRASRSSRIRLTQEEMDLYDSIMNQMKGLNHKLSQVFLEKSGELLETLTDNAEGNQQPSVSNGNEDVETKVQRLTPEEPTNNGDTSARPERDDIVRHPLEMMGVENKESLHN